MPNQQVKRGMVNVIYVDADSNVIDHRTASGQIGKFFNIIQYEHQVPSGYRYVKLINGNNVFEFKSRLQMVMIRVKRRHHPVASASVVAQSSASSASASASRHSSEKRSAHAPHYASVIQLSSLSASSTSAQTSSSSAAGSRSSASHSASSQARSASSRFSVAPYGISNVRRGMKHPERPQDFGAILKALGTSLHDLGKIIQHHDSK